MDLVAIGENLKTVSETGNGYIDYSNTFGAGAIATGISSLIFDLDNNLTPDDVSNILKITADPIGINPGDENTKTGWGLINASAALDFVNEFQFTRGTIIGGVSTKIKNDEWYTIFNGIWGDLSSQNYYVDIYEVKNSIDINPFDEIYIWLRISDTKGWSSSNYNYQTPFASFEVKGSEIITTTHSWFIEANIIDNFNWWRPLHKDNVRVAYTMASKPRTENTETIFVVDGSINTNQSFGAATLYVNDNVTVTIESEVSMTNTEVYLGKNAKIEVRNGGRLITDGAHFKRLDPSKQFKGIYLYTNGNHINNSIIDGGYYGVYGSNSDTDIDGSLIKNNVYGIRLWGSDVHLTGSTIKNNSVDGILAFRSYIRIDPNQPIEGSNTRPSLGSYTRSIFQGNGDNAIAANFTSTVHIYNSDFYGNDGHDIKLDTGSRVYMGYYNNPFQNFGNNNFGYAYSSRKYIWNAAMTASGETSTQWTVPARKNYWNGTTPSSSKFYGSVDYQYALNAPAEALSPPSGEGECTQPPCMLVNTRPFEQVLSSGVVTERLNDGAFEEELDDIQRIKTHLNTIINRINDARFNPRITRWMRTAYALVDMVEDKSLIESEIDGLKKIRRKWLARFHKLNNLKLADSLNQEGSVMDLNKEFNVHNGNRRNLKIQATQLIGEYLVALEMERALSNGKHFRVTKLFNRFDRFIHNKDMRREILGILLITRIENEEYGTALAILNEIEQMQPDHNMRSNWVPGDYETLRIELQHLVDDTGQEVQFKKSEGENVQLEELPNGFVVEQAYPNPFNPNTVIPFKLSESGKVKIEVFDVTGRMVSVLTNQVYNAGSHSVQFNASNLASGIYMVKSEIKGQITSQSITLIK